MIQDMGYFGERKYLATWETGHVLPPRDLITQVSAVCFTPQDQIVMIGEQRGSLHIPGGHPENGEPLDEALHREIWEETCCRIVDSYLLGWQRVEDMTDGAVHYQMRYACKVLVETFEPKHEISSRTIVEANTFLENLEYGDSPIAAEIYRLAVESNKQLATSEQPHAADADKPRR